VISIGLQNGKLKVARNAMRNIFALLFGREQSMSVVRQMTVLNTGVVYIAVFAQQLEPPNAYTREDCKRPAQRERGSTSTFLKHVMERNVHLHSNNEAPGETL